MATVTANETTAGDSLETLRENLNLLRSDLSGLSAADLTGSTNNTITTVTGSGAIQGEANLTFDGSTLTVTGAVTSSGLITANGNIVIANDGNIGSAGDTDAISIDSSGNVTISQNLTVSGTQTTVDTVTMNAANAIVFEGATADAHETTLSIVDPTGDHTQYLINQGGYIPVLAAATTTAITSTPAELNLLDDAAANSVVNSKAVIYGSSGELAGTLSTAAQGNVTSLGTLTTLTVDNIIINGTNIGHTSDTDAISISSGGVVNISATTASTNSTSGALTVGGGAGIAADLGVGDDLRMISDSAVISFGADSEITITHVHDVGLTLTHTATGDDTPMVLQLKSEEDGINANEVISSLEFAAGDSNGGDGAGVAAGIHAIAEDTFSATANATKLVFTTGVSESAAASATAKATLSSIGDFQVAGDLVVKDDGLIGSDSDKDAIAIASNGVVTFSQSPVLSGASISAGTTPLTALDIDGGTDIGAGISDADLFIIDDGAGGTNRKVAASRLKTFVGSTSGALDDLTVGDAASTLATSAGNITIDAQGNNTDIIFKGTDGGADITMLTLDGSEDGTATFKSDILIKDDGKIGSASATSAMIIDSNGIVAFIDDIKIKDGGTIGVASTVDAMTISSAGIVTFKDDILIKDGGTIGSASDADSIAIAANGVVTFSQAPVFPDGSLAIADLDIDGGTDIGAALTTSDLIVVDDGAGGTNRKAALSRVVTLTSGEATALAIALG